MDKKAYKQALYQLQIELVKLQRHVIGHDHRVLVILEGRDAAGKDGAIKRITAHLSPRETRVFAPGKPTEREDRAWYFQRYIGQLPVDGEIVLFNRSWYNRAGVEKVMGYCTQDQYENFLDTVNEFELLLVRSGIHLLKYYLDINKAEQKARLADRRTDPLAQWKLSPVDESAQKLWGEYSKARDVMLKRTSSEAVPWYIVKADDKKQARLNLIRDLLSRVDCPDRDMQQFPPDRGIVFPFALELMREKQLAP